MRISLFYVKNTRYKEAHIKNLILPLFISVLFISSFADDVRLKPYVLAGIEKGEMQAVSGKIESALNENGFTILGKYSPMQEQSRLVIVASHDLLIEPVKKIGGLCAFAAVIRFGIYKNGDNMEVSYTNPLILGGTPSTGRAYW